MRRDSGARHQVSVVPSNSESKGVRFHGHATTMPTADHFRFELLVMLQTITNKLVTDNSDSRSGCFERLDCPSKRRGCETVQQQPTSLERLTKKQTSFVALPIRISLRNTECIARPLAWKRSVKRHSVGCKCH